jgi:hypothetical protein
VGVFWFGFQEGWILKNLFFFLEKNNSAKPRERVSDVKGLCEREGAVKSVRAIRARSFSRECVVKKEIARACVLFDDLGSFEFIPTAQFFSHLI